MAPPPEWSPERLIDARLAGSVIGAQFPALAGQPVRAFDAGWDNAVFAVGDDWLFRFIHRSIALKGAASELAVLTHLDDRFILRIPRPLFVGSPTPEVPWPFWGARAIPGTELGPGLADDERTQAASAVGTFLRELHAPALADEVRAALHAPRGRGGTGDDDDTRDDKPDGDPDDTPDDGRSDHPLLPIDPIGRGNPSTLVPRARARLETLAETGAWQPDPLVDEVFAAAEPLGASTDEPVLVHGDLHVRHLLVAADGRASGVIDWGDTCLADPAVDLMIAWMGFTGRARQALLAAYGPVPADRELRARACAIHVAAALAASAVEQGLTSVAAEALAGLARAAR